MPAKKKAVKSVSKPRVKSARKLAVSSSNSQPSFKNALIGIGVFALLGIGIYSYNTYKNSEIETSGVVICNDEGVCEKSMHIHADIEIMVCDKKFDLPKDIGNLADTHTHKEDNLLHWHDKVKVDASGNTTGGEDDRRISSVIELYLKAQTPEKCLSTGKTGKYSLTVNNTVVEDAMNYVWKEDDKIKLTYE